MSKEDQKGAFALPQYMEAIEALLKAEEQLSSLAERFDEGTQKRDVLNNVCNTIYMEVFDELASVIGHDFVDCTVEALMPKAHAQKPKKSA